MTYRHSSPVKRSIHAVSFALLTASYRGWEERVNSRLGSLPGFQGESRPMWNLLEAHSRSSFGSHGVTLSRSLTMSMRTSSTSSTMLYTILKNWLTSSTPCPRTKLSFLASARRSLEGDYPGWSVPQPIPFQSLPLLMLWVSAMDDTRPALMYLSKLLLTEVLYDEWQSVCEESIFAALHTIACLTAR